MTWYVSDVHVQIIFCINYKQLINMLLWIQKVEILTTFLYCTHFYDLMPILLSLWLQIWSTECIVCMCHVRVGVCSCVCMHMYAFKTQKKIQWKIIQYKLHYYSRHNAPSVNFFSCSATAKPSETASRLTSMSLCRNCL